MKSREVAGNQKYRRLVAVLNIGAIVAILNDARTNPEGFTAEHQLDFAQHLFSLSLVFPGLYNKIEAPMLAMGGNVARLAQIAYHLSNGTSALPLAANIGDIGNHVANMFYFYNSSKKSSLGLFNAGSQDDKSGAEIAKKSDLTGPSL